MAAGSLPISRASHSNLSGGQNAPQAKHWQPSSDTRSARSRTESSPVVEAGRQTTPHSADTAPPAPPTGAPRAALPPSRPHVLRRSQYTAIGAQSIGRQSRAANWCTRAMGLVDLGAGVNFGNAWERRNILSKQGPPP